jgi:hypothetical protein
MPLVAVTRLRVRSYRFLLPFAWQAWRSFRQAKHAAGSLGVTLRTADGLAFWTMTAWQDEAAMHAYRIAHPHRDAMPKLLEWCDEAAVAHWHQASAELPGWETAERRLAESGRVSKVNHPSVDQQAGRLDFMRQEATLNDGGIAMQLSREARLVAGITLFAVPTIVYGGITLLGILTKGTSGLAPGGLALDDTQWALFRAGHAHAGVWVIFSLVLQVLLDSATLPAKLTWLARISTPVAAVAISGGFFGLAFLPAFRWFLYFGAASLVVAVVLAGIGLVRRPSGDA